MGLKKTREAIENGNYDIIHCHGSRANLTGALLKRHFDIPFISTVHSDYKLDYLGRPLAAMTYGRLNKLALHHMDYRVCVSDSMRQTLIDRGFDPVFGARPLKRYLQSTVETLIARAILAGDMPAGHVIKVDVRDGELVCE